MCGEDKRRDVLHFHLADAFVIVTERPVKNFTDYRVSYNIRSAHPVKENWRVQELGGYLYTVVAIEPNKDKGFKTLICERVNE